MRYLSLGAVFVVLTMSLAARKHRKVWLWGINACFSVIAALIALAFFGDLQKMTPDEAQRSLRKEKITSAVLIVLGGLALLSRLGVFH